MNALLAPAAAALFPIGGVALIAAHDIGKITPGFLMKSSVWREKWQEALGLDAPERYSPNHAIVGQNYLAGIYRKPALWLMSVGGHHGMYCTVGAKVRSVVEGEIKHPWVVSCKKELFAEITQIFGALPDEEINKSARLHWFTGLMIFCDWIGSNTKWFPLDDLRVKAPPVAVNAARSRAHNALNEIGWHSRAVTHGLALPQLFKSATCGGFQPRPLQEILFQTVDSSGLYIVEAPMGAGKTEAALIAAYLRWTKGGESGLYFALPTQLTSNRIHERIEQFLRNIITDKANLALVHGNAWLSDKRLTALQAAYPDDDQDQGDQADEGNRWFSDNRKAMLAAFGVGTIDQVLMAVMPVKFSAIRLFALGGKVVIMDEVHSYDPYTSALIDRAVSWLLEVGCTVIILSATLTQARRAALVKAAGIQEEIRSHAYPLITKLTKASPSPQEIEVGTEKKVFKHVQIRNVAAHSAAWERSAVGAAESGACVVVICNTIAFAQKTYNQLKSACRDGKDIQFGLLHSRFPQFRREENEEKWMRLLGKGEAERPRGCILVGTQVLEQSVDIDADLLITELAPTDLIFQRIGRLHRHVRDRPPGFVDPHCILLQPQVDWSNPAKEIKKALGAAAYVYPPFSLYMSQDIWGKKTTLVLPDEIRPILEKSGQVLTGADLPTGVATLKKDFDEKSAKQIQTALSKGVFGITVNDLDRSLLTLRES